MTDHERLLLLLVADALIAAQTVSETTRNMLRQLRDAIDTEAYALAAVRDRGAR